MGSGSGAFHAQTVSAAVATAARRAPPQRCPRGNPGGGGGRCVVQAAIQTWPPSLIADVTLQAGRYEHTLL
ncbi:hypothetical protein GCM10009799_19960 [Nocardiopsis rhodophaea]|uniref:Uncharacterized protein n=1 Tax=Nocardiopsis rhodophaea TaxID=280238 RepID=A0ABN2SXL8_9ACTN